MRLLPDTKGWTNVNDSQIEIEYIQCFDFNANVWKNGRQSRKEVIKYRFDEEKLILRKDNFPREIVYKKICKAGY
jgi:hypothetical protein